MFFKFSNAGFPLQALARSRRRYYCDFPALHLLALQNLQVKINFEQICTYEVKFWIFISTCMLISNIHKYLDNLQMKISSKKIEFDAKYICLKRANFVLMHFLHFQFPIKFRFPRNWKMAYWRKIQNAKQCIKTAFARFNKINFASSLHFFNEIFISS